MPLDDKRVVITGVRDESSLNHAVAELAQAWGADVVIASPGC